MTLKELFNLDIPININVEELAYIIGVSYEGFMEILDDDLHQTLICTSLVLLRVSHLREKPLGIAG